MATVRQCGAVLLNKPVLNSEESAWDGFHPVEPSTWIERQLSLGDLDNHGMYSFTLSVTGNGTCCLAVEAKVGHKDLEHREDKVQAVP